MVTFQQIMFDSLVILIFVIGIVAAFVGMGLVLRSKKMIKFFAVMNRYVSTRKSFKPVSVPHDIESVVRRYRWHFAVAIIAGSVYSLFNMISNFSVAAIIGAAAMSNVFTVAVTEALRWFMVVMNILALAVGIMLGFFPGTLNKIEARANRWYSVRKATVGAEVVHLTFDKWVEAYPRAAGLAIMFGSLIMLMSTSITWYGSWY